MIRHNRADQTRRLDGIAGFEAVEIKGRLKQAEKNKALTESQFAPESESRAMERLKTFSGFTLLEVLIVMMILGIAAMLAVPMMSSAAGTQLRAAANMIAADLEYAKSMSISRQEAYRVVFDESNESYEVQDSSGAVVEHPVDKGNYEVNFSTDGRLDQVDICDAEFQPNSSETVTFDYLGSPYSGAGTSDPLNSGSIKLGAGTFSATINIEPITGYISVSE